jgi:hypothetical protein
MIQYQDFIKILNEKNIELFDFQKRIGHLELNKIIFNQKGGYEKINKLDNFQLEKIILLLLDNNQKLASKLLNMYFN